MKDIVKLANGHSIHRVRVSITLEDGTTTEEKDLYTLYHSSGRPLLRGNSLEDIERELEDIIYDIDSVNYSDFDIEEDDEGKPECYLGYWNGVFCVAKDNPDASEEDDGRLFYTEKGDWTPNAELAMKFNFPFNVYEYVRGNMPDYKFIA